MADVNEIRSFLRERAKEMGLPGKGQCYNDKRKKSRVVKVGLTLGGKGINKIGNPNFEADWKTLKILASEAHVKFPEILFNPCEIFTGCHCCSGSDIGILFKCSI